MRERTHYKEREREGKRMKRKDAKSEKMKQTEK
jgi:hypothetical protein